VFNIAAMLTRLQHNAFKKTASKPEPSVAWLQTDTHAKMAYKSLSTGWNYNKLHRFVPQRSYKMIHFINFPKYELESRASWSENASSRVHAGMHTQMDAQYEKHNVAEGSTGWTFRRKHKKDKCTCKLTQQHFVTKLWNIPRTNICAYFLSYE